MYNLQLRRISVSRPDVARLKLLELLRRAEFVCHCSFGFVGGGLDVHGQFMTGSG